MTHKVLIANRGEIAVRIIRACKEQGIQTVAVYSVADEDSLHIKLADEAVCIGKAESRDSYLNIQRIIAAAIATGANAIHPGYGYLAENARFADIVNQCNLIFIGPSADSLALLGDKTAARREAKKQRIPILPGSDDVVSSESEALEIAKKIGFPVLLKAANGGGGKGIRVVQNPEDFAGVFAKTKLEAGVSFGEDGLYVEKYLGSVRHIEVQILADEFGNVVHFGERDCSMQRRNQKVIEETPSPVISGTLRRNLTASAVKFARAINYKNAGTVEFLVTPSGEYYFIEMNARIQVEHPVTEMAYNIDLVKWQLRVAFGSPLDLKQISLCHGGHTIECRVLAEETLQDFRPSPGLIANIVYPGGPGIRIDTHIFNGWQVSPYYDSLLAKVIVNAPTRKEAIRKMRVALEGFIIDGIATNLDFLYVIMHNPVFVRGDYDTDFVMRAVREEMNGQLH